MIDLLNFELPSLSKVFVFLKFQRVKRSSQSQSYTQTIDQKFNRKSHKLALSLWREIKTFKWMIPGPLLHFWMSVSVFKFVVFQIGAKCAGVSIFNNWDKSEVAQPFSLWCHIPIQYNTDTDTRHYNVDEGRRRVRNQFPSHCVHLAAPRIITQVINFLGPYLLENSELRTGNQTENR